MEIEILADKLSSWIADKVKEAGCRGAVFGMSGGIDSSVVAVLSKHALGENVLGVLIPCYSIPQDEEHALAVAEKFSIRTQKVVLDTAFDALTSSLPDNPVDEAAGRLATANLKARLRMVTWYHFANQLRYLVVGSGNRSELAVGYSTKYGDSGVDILPLGNLVKTQVRDLAEYLEVPREIIDKPPSAGLWEGQTDEDDLGFTYGQLDSFLLTGETDTAVKQRIQSMMVGSRHKTQPPPIPPF
ncbi:MAG: NAD(+) synthase [Dehalococcoidales bacterium]|nr:MAG: NAD(+) synthase [Dehalococcoidales bacterium]